MPRVYTKRKMVESQEQKVGQDGVREFTSDHQLPKSDIEIVDGPVQSKKLDEMAFMNEMVTVRIHPTTDKNANPFPEVWVNGRVQRFVRGEEQKVRRCFVEVLARAKGTTYDNVKAKDPNGEDKYMYPSHTAEVYPFTVINDTPRGEAWLKAVLASA